MAQRLEQPLGERTEAAVKKKRLYKKWVNDRDGDYAMYREANKEAKKVGEKENQKAWINYGEDLSADSRSAVRRFCKKVKAVKRQNA